MITIRNPRGGGGGALIERTKSAYSGITPTDTDYLAILQDTTSLTLTGNMLYYPRKVTLTSANDLSTATFSISGLDENDDPVSETGVVGPNNETISFSNWYSDITAITASEAVTGIEAGVDDIYLLLDRSAASIHDIAPLCPTTIAFENFSEIDDIYVYFDTAGLHPITWPSSVYWRDSLLPRLSIYGRDWLRFNTLDSGTTVEGALMTLQNLQEIGIQFIDFVTTGSTFSPTITTTGGVAQWDWSDDTIDYGTSPVKDFGTGAIRTQRLTMSDWETLNSLNVDDENIDSIVFNCPGALFLTSINVQRSTAREIVLQKLPGLTNFDAAYWVNYTTYEGAQSLETLEFLDCPNLETVDLRNAASLTSIDLTRCPKISSFQLSHSSSVLDVNLSGLTQLTSLTLGYYYNYVNYYGLRNLETVNIDGCTGLTYFELGDVTKVGMELDLTGAPNIETVRLWRWNGTSLDVSGNTHLEFLYLHRFYNYNNCESVPYLETINLTGCTGLTTFDMRYESKSSTVNLDLDFTDSTNLTTVVAWSPQITSIDVSNTPIQSLQLSYYSNYVNYWGSNRMTTLSVDGCNSLQSITACHTTALTTLDASDLATLDSVTLWDSGIETLDISNTPIQDLTLGFLYNDSYKWGCPDLTSLTLTGCTQLQTIYFGATQQLQQSFDLSGKTTLESFTSWNSAITGLNFSGCTNLTSVVTTGLVGASIYPSEDIATMNLTGCTSLVTYLSGGDKVTTLDFTDFTPLQNCRIIKSDYLTSVNLNGLQNLTTIELGYGYYSSYYPIAHAIALNSVSMVGCAGAPTVRICGGIMSSLDFAGQNRLGDVYIFNLTQLTTLDFSNSSVQTITGSSYQSVYPGDDYYDLPLLQSIDLTACTSLTTLDLQHSGNITSLDCSPCTNLQELYINGSGVQQINLTGCSNLTKLRTGIRWAGSHYTRFGRCDNLTSITLTGCTAIQTADLAGLGAVTTLDATPCTALQDLTCYDSPLLQTVNCSGLSNLQTLRASSGSYQTTTLTSINVTGCIALKTIYAQQTGALVIDISTCVSLQLFVCYGSDIASLDASGLTALQEIDAYDSTGSCDYLATVNITGCTALTDLDVRFTKITNLDQLYTCTNIDTVQVRGCSLITSIDAHGCTSLRILDAYALGQTCPLLASVDVAGCTGIVTLDLNSTALDSAEVDQILTDLDTNGNSNGTVDLRNTAAPGASGLTAKTNLQGKGWTVNTD